MLMNVIKKRQGSQHPLLNRRAAMWELGDFNTFAIIWRRLLLNTIMRKSLICTNYWSRRASSIRDLPEGYSVNLTKISMRNYLVPDLFQQQTVIDQYEMSKMTSITASKMMRASFNANQPSVEEHLILVKWAQDHRMKVSIRILRAIKISKT